MSNDVTFEFLEHSAHSTVEGSVFRFANKPIENEFGSLLGRFPTLKSSWDRLSIALNLSEYNLAQKSFRDNVAILIDQNLLSSDSADYLISILNLTQFVHPSEDEL